MVAQTSSLAKRQAKNLGKAAALLPQMTKKRSVLANVTNQRHGSENGSRSSTNLERRSRINEFPIPPSQYNPLDEPSLLGAFLRPFFWVLPQMIWSMGLLT